MAAMTNKARKAGRPPHQDQDQKRTQSIRIPLSRAEKDRIDQRRGLVSAAAFVRDKALNA